MAALAHLPLWWPLPTCLTPNKASDCHLAVQYHAQPGRSLKLGRLRQVGKGTTHASPAHLNAGRCEWTS